MVLIRTFILLFFISNLIEKNNKEIIKLINTTIKNKKISIALFEGDHISIINFDFINSIKVKKKGLFLFLHSNFRLARGSKGEVRWERHSLQFWSWISLQGDEDV